MQPLNLTVSTLIQKSNLRELQNLSTCSPFILVSINPKISSLWSLNISFKVSEKALNPAPFKSQKIDSSINNTKAKSEQGLPRQLEGPGYHLQVPLLYPNVATLTSQLHKMIGSLCFKNLCHQHLIQSCFSDFMRRILVVLLKDGHSTIRDDVQNHGIICMANLPSSDFLFFCISYNYPMSRRLYRLISTLFQILLPPSGNVILRSSLTIWSNLQTNIHLLGKKIGLGLDLDIWSPLFPLGQGWTSCVIHAGNNVHAMCVFSIV